MLPSSSHIETAYLGKNGIAEGLTAGRLCVDMSTVDPAASRRVAQSLAAKGVRFIDAPVSGGVPRAEEGTLAIMVGGEARDVEEARPALIAMGANVIHVGAVGSGARWPSTCSRRPGPYSRLSGWGAPPAPPIPPNRSARPGDAVARLDPPQRSSRPGEAVARLDPPQRSSRPGEAVARLDPPSA